MVDILVEAVDFAECQSVSGVGLFRILGLLHLVHHHFVAVLVLVELLLLMLLHLHEVGLLLLSAHLLFVVLSLNHLY